jgi:hypothetical protein
MNHPGLKEWSAALAWASAFWLALGLAAWLIL